MKKIVWAIFGNDEDGPYGFFEHTPIGAVRWWLRNPFHNLLFHVLNRPGGPIYRWGHKPGWNGYIGFRDPHGAFGIAIRKETN